MKHLLIADDDPFIVKIWKKKLEDADFVVATVNDGKAAIEFLKKSQPDAMILDLILPEVNGVKVLEFIRTSEHLRNIPVIVVSNSSYFSGIVQAAWNAGATHFLQKGDSTPKQLVEAVTDALSPKTSTKISEPELEQIKTASRSTSARILVADDDRLIHSILGFFLTQANLKINSAYDGKQALESAASEPPDLMILDVVMPVMNGFEVIKKWRNNPKLSNIPIIMLTSLDDGEKSADAINSDLTSFLMKPFNPDQLMSLIKTYISKN